MLGLVQSTEQKINSGCPRNLRNFDDITVGVLIMGLGEFELIELFKKQSVKRDDVLLGIGDDAALLEVAKGMQLAVTTDTLVEGTHFLVGADPAFVAYKALVSNISDLAAMGAVPAWCSLALTLPKVDNIWLNAFCQSFLNLAQQYNIALIGGDTTKGPLAITITLHGFVEANKALRRKGARVGDYIFVSGNLGDSLAGLKLILEQKNTDLSSNEQALVKKHFHKTPRVELGQALVGLASSCLDISDGLAADLKHILRASQVGALIDADKLPVSHELLSFAKEKSIAAQMALISGEEYELCFTLPPDKLNQLNALSFSNSVTLTHLGQITATNELKITWQGTDVDWSLCGWEHFN